MKAALNRRQLMWAGGGAVVLLVAAGMAWLGWGGLGEKHAEAQALAERMGNPALAALLADPGSTTRAGREAVELQKLIKDLREQDLSAGWSLAAQELAGNGAEWAKDPGKWKDRLIAIQSDLQKNAPLKRVQLSPDFYLGLGGFRQKSPSTDEVPGLALHLSVAERLVKLLIKAREVAEQYPTDCQILALSGPGSVQEKDGQEKSSAAGTAGSKTGPIPKEFERKAFQIKFRSSPEVLYEYVRLLTTDPALFIVTDLAVVNEKQAFPLRSEIAKKFNGLTPAAGSEGEQEKKSEKRLLEILAGEESLTNSLNVDLIVWKVAEESKVGPSGQSP